MRDRGVRERRWLLLSSLSSEDRGVRERHWLPLSSLSSEDNLG